MYTVKFLAYLLEGLKLVTSLLNASLLEFLNECFCLKDDLKFSKVTQID